MIPSQRWFPSSLQDRAAWFNNFATQFAVVGAGLGFTEAEVTAVGADNTAFQKLASITVQLDAYADAVRQFRVVITEGSIGDPNPSFPALPAYTAVTGVSTGIFERLDQLVKRIRVAPSYTDETGALLGIVPAKSENAVETELKPILKTSTLPGNVVEIDFTRGKTDGVDIQIRIDNQPDWTNGGRFFKSPAILNIPDGTGLPRAVQIRARYLQGNAPVGQNSDTVNVVTQP